jgi:hypothetical protein
MHGTLLLILLMAGSVPPFMAQPLPTAQSVPDCSPTRADEPPMCKLDILWLDPAGRTWCLRDIGGGQGCGCCRNRRRAPSMRSAATGPPPHTERCGRRHRIRAQPSTSPIRQRAPPPTLASWGTGRWTRSPSPRSERAPSVVWHDGTIKQVTDAMRYSPGSRRSRSFVCPIVLANRCPSFGISNRRAAAHAALNPAIGLISSSPGEDIVTNYRNRNIVQGKLPSEVHRGGLIGRPVVYKQAGMIELSPLVLYDRGLTPTERFVALKVLGKTSAYPSSRMCT